MDQFEGIDRAPLAKPEVSAEDQQAAVSLFCAELSKPHDGWIRNMVEKYDYNPDSKLLVTTLGAGNIPEYVEGEGLRRSARMYGKVTKSDEDAPLFEPEDSLFITTYDDPPGLRPFSRKQLDIRRYLESPGRKDFLNLSIFNHAPKDDPELTGSMLRITMQDNGISWINYKGGQLDVINLFYNPEDPATSLDEYGHKKHLSLNLHNYFGDNAGLASLKAGPRIEQLGPDLVTISRLNPDTQKVEILYTDKKSFIKFGVLNREGADKGYALSEESWKELRKSSQRIIEVPLRVKTAEVKDRIFDDPKLLKEPDTLDSSVDNSWRHKDILKEVGITWQQRLPLPPTQSPADLSI